MDHYSALKSLVAALMAGVLIAGPQAMAVEPNTLTPQELSQGWKLLFDGRSMTGWHGYEQSAPPIRGWHIENGCLVNPKSNGRPNGSGGDLVTDAKYTDFEFSFEWRASQATNSGVHYFFTEGGPRRTVSMYKGDKGDSPMGFEYQILDDAAYPQAENRLTASIYFLVAPTDKKLRPLGEFNEGRIIVRGNHVEHWLNGTKVAVCELGSTSLKQRIAASKFKALPSFGTKAATGLALQDHGEEVTFRNLKLRELRH